MALRWNGIGKLSRKTDLDYDKNGKPYLFISMDTRRDWVQDESKPNEKHDFGIFGEAALVIASMEIGQTIGMAGLLQRRKKKDSEDWELQTVVKEVYLDDGSKQDIE